VQAPESEKLQPSDLKRLWVIYRDSLKEPEAEAYKLRSDDVVQIRSAIARSTKALAHTDPFKELDTSHAAGYLVGEVRGWKVFVPWPLIKLYPGAEMMARLIALANDIAIRPPLALCVSGSIVLLGTQLAAADLDFCQYVSTVPSELVADVAEFRYPREDLILVSARYGHAKPSTPPWDISWPELEQRMRSCGQVDGAERLILEFLRQADWLGAIAASSVVLCSDFDDRTRGAAMQSFIYQEAIALPATSDELERRLFLGPPWSAVEPSNIGAYRFSTRTDN